MTEGECSNSHSLEMGISESKPREEAFKIANEPTNMRTIFKVPNQIIHEHRGLSCRPKILSIGPYHRGSPHLKRMEAVKLNCLHRILGCDSEKYYDTDEIMGLAEKARSVYGNKFTMELREFAEMLLLDGCFILAALTETKGKAVENVSRETANSLESAIGREEVSIKEAETGAMSFYGETAGDRNAIKGKSVLVGETSQGGGSRGTTSDYPTQHEESLIRCDIVHDLLLLENQIPFFIVEKIHELGADQEETTETLKEKIATYVERMLEYYPTAINISEMPSKDFHHLLHVCHMFFQPTLNRAECHPNEANTNQWHRAVQYHEAGVKFKVKDSSTPHSLLDVTFNNGTMEIPHLCIDGETESIFSNFILFEQGYYSLSGKYINAYVIFMSQLLSNAEDVALLVQKGIIEILGSQEEVLTVFSRLDKLAIFDGKDNYLQSMLWPVEEHYRRRLNWWMAWLKHNHLKNPCLALIALGGFIGLLCAIIQALFAVLSYFKPPNQH